MLKVKGYIYYRNTVDTGRQKREIKTVKNENQVKANIKNVNKLKNDH